MVLYLLCLLLDPLADEVCSTLGTLRGRLYSKTVGSTAPLCGRSFIPLVVMFSAFYNHCILSIPVAPAVRLT